MTHVDRQQVRRVFMEVADLPAAQRAAALDRLCGGDATLRVEVELLLQAEEQAAGFMASPTVHNPQSDDAPTRASLAEETPTRDSLGDNAPTRDSTAHNSGSRDSSAHDPSAATAIAGRGGSRSDDSAPASAGKPGALIGRYKLLQLIGEGGFGAVWMAQQEQPVRRKVALKIIKLGMDTQQVVARFEQERQALAILDHPHIAKVLDAGATETGRPYFVMELCTGEPIDAYCDRNHLTIDERLELFAQVCAAVQHAHTKGIIHRDIKPTNVLVATHDGRPHAKVIDFGIAKATASKLTEKTLFTEHRQIIGTPEYMSPEQAEGSLDIDTRTDVYALGVLLYELLTGSTPFTRKELRAAAYAEIQRIIREVDPPKPSTRLNQNSDTLASVAARRKTEPGKLGTIVRGELDWIVMKALEKDRQRRYESANGLAADVRRYLAGEAVLAAPPSRTYQLRKFVRRNRASVTAGGVVVAALLVGIAGTTWQWSRARAANATLTRQNEGVIESLTQLVHTLNVADPNKNWWWYTFADGRKMTIVRRQGGDWKSDVRILPGHISNPEAALDRPQPPIDPAVAMQTLAIMVEDAATTMYEQTDRANAEAARATQAAQAEKEASARARQRLKQVENANEILASIFKSLDPGEIALAKRPLQAILVEKLDTAVAQLEGESVGDAQVVADMQMDLGDSLVSLGEPLKGAQVLEKARATYAAALGPDHPDTLTCMNDLAIAYQTAGKLSLALPMMEQTLALRKSGRGADQRETITCMNNLALIYKEIPEKAELAAPLLEQALELRKALDGPEHPETANAMHNLALAYMHADKYDRALPLLEEALRIRTATIGERHPHTLLSRKALAACYTELGKPDAAYTLSAESLAKAKEALGAEHPVTLALAKDLAKAYFDAGKLAETQALLEETLPLLKAKLGPDHRETILATGNLAGIYWMQGKLEKSVPLFEQVVRDDERTLGPDDRETLRQKANLGVNYSDARRFEEAIPLLEAVHAASPDHPDLEFSLPALLECYARGGHPAQAAALLPEFTAYVREQLPPKSARLATVLAKVGDALLDGGLFPAAEELLRESVALRDELQPDALTTFNARSLLGGAIAGQGRFAEAEPLLLAGFEGVQERADELIARNKHFLPRAAARVVQLYTAWHAAEPERGHDAQAAVWQAKLNALNTSNPTEPASR